ncbi:MAG TPA: Yip1 family protein [Anaerolineales bacterium]|nr:Yip1 family protein [Anaerolineales bacterium]
MNEQPNAPMLPDRPQPMFQTWINALTKPSEETYVQIANSPQAKTGTALLWVFVGSLIQSFIVFLLQGVLMNRMMQGSGFESPMSTSLIGVLCGAPVAAAISVVLFASFTGIVQWIAGLFGGRGSFEKLVYVLAAITVPFTLVSALFTLLSAIPFVGFCFGLVSLLAALYVLYLEVMAVKAVNQFDWGKAAASLLLPGVVIFCCVLVAIGGLFSILGPQMQDIFNQINQSITP